MDVKVISANPRGSSISSSCCNFKAKNVGQTGHSTSGNSTFQSKSSTSRLGISNIWSCPASSWTFFGWNVSTSQLKSFSNHTWLFRKEVEVRTLLWIQILQQVVVFRGIIEFFYFKWVDLYFWPFHFQVGQNVYASRCLAWKSRWLSTKVWMK